MCIVVGVGIAGSHPISGAEPWFQFGQDLRLEPGFNVKCVSALLLGSPAARLHGSPSQEIDRAGVSRDGMHAVASVGIDADVFGVTPTHCQRPVVGLQNAPPVNIFEKEYARVGCMLALAPFVGV